MYLKSYISRPGRRASAVAALFGAIALPTALTAQPVDVTGWDFDLNPGDAWSITGGASNSPTVAAGDPSDTGEARWFGEFAPTTLEVGETLRLTAQMELVAGHIGWNHFRVALMDGTFANGSGYAVYFPTGDAGGHVRGFAGSGDWWNSAGYSVDTPAGIDQNMDQGTYQLTLSVRLRTEDRMQINYRLEKDGGYLYSGVTYDEGGNGGTVSTDTFSVVGFRTNHESTSTVNEFVFSNVQVEVLPPPAPPAPPTDEEDADVTIINDFEGGAGDWTNNGFPTIFTVAAADDDGNGVLSANVAGTKANAAGFRWPVKVTLTGADFDAIKDASETEIDAALRFDVTLVANANYAGPASIHLRVEAPGSDNRTNFGNRLELDEWPEENTVYFPSASIKGLNIDEDADEITLYIGVSTDAAEWGDNDVDYTIYVDNVRVVEFAEVVAPPLEGKGANAWGFEGTNNGGMRLVNTDNGIATLERISPVSGNAGDIRLRAALEEAVSIGSGESAVFFGQFTVGTTARQGETLIEGFEAITVGEGVETENRFVLDPDTLAIELDGEEVVEGNTSLKITHDGAATLTRNAALDLTGKSHLIIRYMADSAGTVDAELILDNTFNSNTETWHIAAELTADGEWQELVIPVEALQLNELGGNSLAAVGRTLDAITAWTVDVVDSNGAGEFYLDFFSAAESLDAADVMLNGVETRFALINTQGNGGTLAGTGWVGEDDAPLALGNASGYMTVIRTGGDVNWAGGVPGPLGAVVNSNWPSTYGNNVGFGGEPQNTIEEEAEEGEEPEIRYAQALAGTYTFEIRVQNLWDSRSFISYKIAGGADEYVLEGSEFIDRGVMPNGTVAAGETISSEGVSSFVQTFDAVGFRFNGSPFTTVSFSGVQVAKVAGDAIDPWTLYTFEEDEEGWEAHEGENAELDWVDGELEIAPAAGGFLWSARVDMPVKSLNYEAIRDAKSMNTDLAPLGITFDVTLDPARSGGYADWFQIFVALQSGSNWNQYDQVVDTSWPVAAEEGEDDPQITFKATLPLGRFSLDEEGESINLILGVNSGITDEEYSILVDNFEIVQIESTPANKRAAAGAFFGVTVGTDHLAETTAGWYYTLYFPWVFSYNLAEVRPGNVNGWLYANAIGGVTLADGAWFWDHGVQEWWLTATAVYPWAYSSAQSDWVNIHVYPFQN